VVDLVNSIAWLAVSCNLHVLLFGVDAVWLGAEQNRRGNEETRKENAVYSRRLRSRRAKRCH
jgi:hypothetical protein